MTRFKSLAVATAALVALAVAAAPTGGASATSNFTVVFFRTPSKNIYCAYNSAGAGSPAFLRCDIRSRLLHPTPKPHRCVEGVYGESVGMTKTGAAHVLCISDTTYDPKARVLAYGHTWARDGFRCVSRSAGLTCTNKRKHGFFLSRERWNVH
jgi:Family of unknown function (DUF6636)